MKRRIIWILPLLLLTLCKATLHAQAKLAIYGTFGGEKSGLPNIGWTTAGTLGLYVGVSRLGPLALSVDGRADLSSKINSVLIGPRLALRLPGIPIKPYAEILIGGSSYSKTAAGLKDPSQFAARAVFGADSTILPHIDWRVLDFSYTLNDSSNTGNAETLSTGLVLRF
jgi:hypothetical protein